MIGSANELHLDAFREHPEFASFRGRFELLRAPYLRSYLDEQAHLRHADRAARRAATSRRTRPASPRSSRSSRACASPRPSATPTRSRPSSRRSPPSRRWISTRPATPPERLDPDAQKVLRAGIRAIYEESDSSSSTSRAASASPRARCGRVLLDAAQSPDHACLSPFAVLDELDELCKRTAEFDWLKEKQLAGGYHDHRSSARSCARACSTRSRRRCAPRAASSTRSRYAELFDRYITHVSVWVKGEKIRNPHTGEYESPDERMMREVEGLLGVQAEARRLPPRAHLRHRRLGDRSPRARRSSTPSSSRSR